MKRLKQAGPNRMKGTETSGRPEDFQTQSLQVRVGGSGQGSRDSVREWVPVRETRRVGNNPSRGTVCAMNASSIHPMRRANPLMITRLRHLLRGFRSNLKFSNWAWLTYNRLFRRSARAVTYIWKERFYIVCDCSRGDHISVQEVIADRAYDQFIEKALPAGSEVSYVNIGANVGAFDLMLIDRGFRIRSGLAVELNPFTFQRCLLNLRTNDAANVEVVNCGIADSDRQIRFTPSQSSLGDSIINVPPDGQSTRDTQTVELVTLSTLLQRHGKGTEEIDLLKLDCEGAEYQIIESTPSELLRRFRAIVIEFHEEPSPGAIKGAYERLANARFTAENGVILKPNFVELFVRN